MDNQNFNASQSIKSNNKVNMKFLIIGTSILIIIVLYFSFFYHQTPKYNKFESTIYLLSKEEGGRHTPIYNDFNCYIKLANKKIKGTITFPNSSTIMMPGDRSKVIITLSSKVEMKISDDFSIYERDNIIGTGTIHKIY